MSQPSTQRPWEWEDPLGVITDPEHSPRESRAALQALNDYAQMGHGRSLNNLLALYEERKQTGDTARTPTTRKATIANWSADHQWQDRIARWQALQLEAEREEWEARRRELRQRQWETGAVFHDLAQAGLEQAPNFISTSRRLIRGADGEPDREIITLKLDARSLREFAETGIDMQRQAAEMDRTAAGTDDDPIHVVGMSLGEWQAMSQARRAAADETLDAFEDGPEEPGEEGDA